jgi:hypothetical protein
MLYFTDIQQHNVQIPFGHILMIFHYYPKNLAKQHVSVLV